MFTKIVTGAMIAGILALMVLGSAMFSYRRTNGRWWWNDEPPKDYDEPMVSRSRWDDHNEYLYSEDVPAEDYEPVDLDEMRMASEYQKLYDQMEVTGWEWLDAEWFWYGQEWLAESHQYHDEQEKARREWRREMGLAA